MLAEDGAAAVGDIHERREIFTDKLSPIGRDFYSRRYYRLALSAWNAGDANAALRYLHIAIQFSPLNSEAIQLRREVVQSSGVQSPDIDWHLREGLPISQHPKVDYSEQGAPWKSPLRLLPPIGEEYYDQGTPGEATTLHTLPK